MMTSAASIAAPAALGARPGATEAARQDHARAVAEDFEAFFLSQVLQQMSKGIETDGPFGGGHSEKMFRGMLNAQYGRIIADAGGIGIADAVYQEMLKLQEARSS